MRTVEDRQAYRAVSNDQIAARLDTRREVVSRWHKAVQGCTATFMRGTQESE